MATGGWDGGIPRGDGGGDAGGGGGVRRGQETIGREYHNRLVNRREQRADSRYPIVREKEG